jgi:hypothetical protein
MLATGHVVAAAACLVRVAGLAASPLNAATISMELIAVVKICFITRPQVMPAGLYTILQGAGVSYQVS